MISEEKMTLPILLAMLLWFGLAMPAWATNQKPLLMPGKHSLYQRVLARPGAELHIEAGSTKVAQNTKPFTAYYIYERQEIAGNTWIKVGTDSHGNTQGWILEKQLIPWKQVLTVAFRNPEEQDRVLLFRDRDSLKKLVESDDTKAYRRLYRAAETGSLKKDSPVIAIQPKNHIDVKKDFYLVPIQQHEDIYMGSGQALMLQVTSVPLKEAQPIQKPKKEKVKPKPRPKQKRFRSGLVFVTDATASMGPYIDRTREAVDKVYKSIEKAGLTDDVSFGLVAYRDNLSATPELEYLSRTYATLEQGKDAATFFRGASALAPSDVSSEGFVEDAYSGIKQAIKEMKQGDYAARYIMLITDAGPRLANDPLSSTGLSTDQLRQMALDNGVSIWVLHLRTPMGKHDHASAAKQYKSLSYYPGIGNFYYGVRMGKVAEFGKVLDALANQITEQVRDAAEVNVAASEPESLPEQAEPEQPVETKLAEFQERVRKLGYALRLKYLRNSQGSAIPSVFNAWLVDHDFQDPQRQTLDIRVLLTRDQLSDLQFVLKQVLAAAEDGLISPRNFLNDLKSLSASLSRDPGELLGSTRATGAGGSNLADLGYMREYIEDLPYTGEVMNLSLDNWVDWPANRQLEFIHRLESKVNYYHALHDHTDLWISLDGGPVTGDSVFPVALEMLP